MGNLRAYREHHDCACAPGRLGGPREEGPERTNPEGGNPRADARIQNPSGTRQPGTNPSCNAELRVAPGPDCDAGPGHIFPLGNRSYNWVMDQDRRKRRKPERCAWNHTAPTTLGACKRSKRCELTAAVITHLK